MLGDETDFRRTEAAEARGWGKEDSEEGERGVVHTTYDR